MTTTFKGNFSATAIGSLPHTDVEAACELMFKSLPDIPCWPQLPKLSIKEDMCIQYTEGLPCAVMSADGKTISIDVSKDTSGSLEVFYDTYLKNDPELIREYEGYHREVWPEIKESIHSSGIVDMEIYRYGNRLFMIMEVNPEFSFEQKGAMDAGNEKVQEWERLMWTYQQPLPWAKPGEKWMPMEKIFSL